MFCKHDGEEAKKISLEIRTILETSPSLNHNIVRLRNKNIDDQVLILQSRTHIKTPRVEPLHHKQKFS